MTLLETLEQELAVAVERYQQQRILVFAQAEKISAQTKVVQQIKQAIADNNEKWHPNKEAALIQQFSIENSKLSSLASVQVGYKQEYQKRIDAKLRIEQRIDDYKDAVIQNMASGKTEAQAEEEAAKEDAVKEQIYQTEKQEEVVNENKPKVSKTAVYTLIGVGLLATTIIVIFVIRKMNKNKVKK